MSDTYIYLILEAILSFKWLWIVVIILGYRTIKKYLDIFRRDTQIKADQLLKDSSYDEKKIIEHLDYIINEALDDYVLFNLESKQVYYINNALETKIVEHLSEEVPKRISVTLQTHLSFIYNSEFIGEYIGQRIYMTVTNYVVAYNLNHEDQARASGVTDIGDAISSE